jgi:hypothetical protein
VSSARRRDRVMHTKVCMYGHIWNAGPIARRNILMAIAQRKIRVPAPTYVPSLFRACIEKYANIMPPHSACEI